MFLVLVLTNASAADQLQLRFEAAHSKESGIVKQLLLKTRVFHNIVRTINLNFRLPEIVRVRFDDGDEGTPYYEPDEVEIVMEYGGFAEAYELLTEETDLSVHDRLKRTFQVGEFFFYHELGHALIDTLELPVLGREEDAADGLAAYLILELTNEPEVALAAARQFLLESETYENDEEDDFYDEHSLDRQRFYNIVAWVYGSDPDRQESNVDELVPDDWWEDRAEGAVEEYEQLVDSWEELLDDVLEKKS
jgi:Putative metallopeptidase